MGRRKKGSGSYAYFRNLFTENPELLEQKSNLAILARYRQDHNLPEDSELERSVRNNLANIKSNMRKEGRKSGKIKAAKNKSAAYSKSSSRLEILEEMIDDCLTLAKSEGKEELKQIITPLRRARNEVVWLLGQP